MRLEQDPNKRIKYLEYIDYYTKLSDWELKLYREKYLPKSSQKEDIMSFRRMFLDEGRKEGEVLMLKRQLSRRFGTVPVWAEDRLKQAEQKDLEIWIDRILDAGSVEEVFKF